MSKMTDKEIIVEALEHCSKGNCSGCPNLATEYCSTPEKFQEEVLDLINRQQAEIERLQNESIGKCELAMSMRNDNNLDVDCSYCIDKVKAEAIKEFAEKLKEHKYQSSDWSHGEHPFVVEESDIDNLVAEMGNADNDT